MRLFVTTLLFVCIMFLSCDACATNYPSSRIERYATNTPRKVENDLNVLVRHLIKPLDDDYDKAKMIAFWIASHINYDEYLYNNDAATKLMKKHKIQSPEELIRSRSGICSEFAMLFAQMCKIAGVSAQIVEGYAYPSKYRLSRRQRINYTHAWNYFYYNGKKVYVDTTFMAKGRISPSGYIRDYTHKRALHSVERDNKYKSQTNDFDDYYFDFSYRREKTERKYTHKEK